MARLRIAAFVSGGPVAQCALDALATSHQVVAVVRPRPVRSSWRASIAQLSRALRVRPTDTITDWAAARGVPVVTAAAGGEERTAEVLRSFAPDFGCIATWPWRIPDPLLAACGRACVNLHTSLLPRHRGRNPLFWTYHAGDREAGASVHLAIARFDAGGIVAQARTTVARGESVVAVHARCADLGAKLLVDALARLADGSAVTDEQDDAGATRAPSPVPGQPYADLAHWSCEQAWHFLAGLLPRYREPLVDITGLPAAYARVDGFELRDPAYEPGAVVPDGSGWTAWTRDGCVRLADA